MKGNGSFWIWQESKSFDRSKDGFLSFQAIEQKSVLSILFRQEYKNISEDKIISRLLFEKYSNNEIGIYLSTSKQETAMRLFTQLSNVFKGYITMLNVRGPIALNFTLQDSLNDQFNVNHVLNVIDSMETVNPIYIRKKLHNLMSVPIAAGL